METHESHEALQHVWKEEEKEIFLCITKGKNIHNTRFGQGKADVYHGFQEVTLKHRHLTEKRNLCKSVDSLMTAGAVVTVGINHPQFTTATTLLLGMTRRERRKHAFCHITPFNGNAVISQSCLINILKISPNFDAPICNRNPATVVPERGSFDFKNLRATTFQRVGYCL